MPSTVIEYAHYDPAQQNLDIKYRSGITYRYLGVPQPIYESYKQSFSKGAYLNSVIKKKYRFQKL